MSQQCTTVECDRSLSLSLSLSSRISLSLFLSLSVAKAVVTTTIRLRFDSRSTPIGLQFAALRPFDDLHYEHVCVCAVALRHK